MNASKKAIISVFIGVLWFLPSSVHALDLKECILNPATCNKNADTPSNDVRVNNAAADKARAAAENLKKEQERLAEATKRQIEEERRIAAANAEAAAKKTESSKPESRAEILANRKALVIGNDGYQNISKLANARGDAKAIAKALEGVGYRVTTLFDLSEKQMKQSFRKFKSEVEGGDEVLFFYAGHGVQLGGANYLLPVDIKGENEEQVKDEAVQLQRVLDDMNERNAKFTLAVIDACRDNPFKVAGRSIGTRGMAPTTAATGQMIIFSAGAGQQALDSLGKNDKNPNSVFTRTFIKEIEKPGLTVDRVLRNVRNQVVEMAKGVGHQQVPALYDQVVGDFYFKR